MSKKVYRIGEAAKLLGVKTSTLRFWEDKFSQIRPKRTETDQRYYSEKDMQVLRRIHTLLHDKGMTISGVQKILKREAKNTASNVMSLGPVRSIRLAGSLVSLSVPDTFVHSQTASFHVPFHAQTSENTLLHNTILTKNPSLALDSSLNISIDENSQLLLDRTALKGELEDKNQKIERLQSNYAQNLLEIKKELECLLELVAPAKSY